MGIQEKCALLRGKDGLADASDSFAQGRRCLVLSGCRQMYVAFRASNNQVSN